MAEQIIEPEVKIDPAADAERKKREAEIKKRGAELKAEKDSLNKQRAEILAEQKRLADEKKQYDEFNKWRAQATTDPDAFLGPVYGKDWRDKLAASTAGDKTPLQIQQLREELQKEIEARRKEKDEADAKSKADTDAAEKAKKDKEEQDFADYAKTLSTTWLDERKEKYPTTHATKMGAEVARRVRLKFLETGEMPNEEEIAAAVETELDTVIESVHVTPKWSEKLAQKFKPPPPVPRKTEPPTFSVARKAISQDMAAGAKPPPTKPLTREQKREMLANLPDDEWNKRVAAAKGLRGTAGGGAEEE